MTHMLYYYFSLSETYSLQHRPRWRTNWAVSICYYILFRMLDILLLQNTALPMPLNSIRDNGPYLMDSPWWIDLGSGEHHGSSSPFGSSQHALTNGWLSSSMACVSVSVYGYGDDVEDVLPISSSDTPETSRYAWTVKTLLLNFSNMPFIVVITMFVFWLILPLLYIFCFSFFRFLMFLGPSQFYQNAKSYTTIQTIIATKITEIWTGCLCEKKKDLERGVHRRKSHKTILPGDRLCGPITGRASSEKKLSDTELQKMQYK